MLSTLRTEFDLVASTVANILAVISAAAPRAAIYSVSVTAAAQEDLPYVPQVEKQ
jgi:hypothetical protein